MIVLVVLASIILIGAIIWSIGWDVVNAVTEVDQRLHSPRPMLEVRVWIMTTIVASMRRDRYEILGQSQSALDLLRKRRAALTWFLTIMTFPIGLVFYFNLVIADEFTIRLYETADGGTDVHFAGMVPYRYADQIEMVETPYG
jgi:hypothetical protein